MKIRTGSRLHFGLIDLNGTIGRVDGSIGLSVTDPGAVLNIRDSDEISVQGDHSDTIRQYAEIIKNHFDIDNFSITIESKIPRHAGLGSGTQYALATAKLVTKFNGMDIPPAKLARIVGRGGTSGIGTKTFETGGFVLDGGHSIREKDGILPSSSSNADPPPIVTRVDFPDWNIKIYIPKGKNISGSKEEFLFNEGAPIPINEVREVSHIVLMKLLPSIIEADYNYFRQAISDLQSVGWKRRELDKQPYAEKIIKDLSEKGVAAGLSSWGPAVYAISPGSIDYAYNDCKSFVTNARNCGAEIIS